MRRRYIPHKAFRNGRRDYPEPLQCQTLTDIKTADPERSRLHSAMVRVNQPSLV